MRVLAVNAGSSSLKLRVLDGEELVGTAEAERSGLAQGIRDLLDELGPVDAVGHRVVHGGSRHVEPELVDDVLVHDLEELVPLAPLHQPTAIEGIRVAREVAPDAPSVACFDTAFHHHLPAAAATYALPAAWRERFGLRRFGAQ